jgi:hypothetical protein
MKIVNYWTEVFYSPKAFFRLRKNSPNIRYFLTVFPLLAYMLAAAAISLGVGFRVGFFQFFIFTLIFYGVGFLKTSLYTSLLNFEEPVARFRDVWFWNAVALFPLVIFFPLLAAISNFKGVFLMGFFFVLGYSNYKKTKYLENYYGRKMNFVWAVSLLEVLFIVILVSVVLGTGILFFITLIRETASQLMTQ